MSHESSTEAPSRERHKGRETCGSLSGLIAGLVAGGAICVLLWQFDPEDPHRKPFSVPQEIRETIEDKGFVVPPPELMSVVIAAEKKALILNKVLFIGLFGTFMGVGLGIAHGIKSRSALSALWAIGSCGIVGGLFGCAAGLAGHFAFELLPVKTDYDPLAIAVLGQGVMLGVLGAGVGLGFGIGTRRGLATLNCVIFGLIAGVMAACIFSFSASLLVADVATDVAIPDGMSMGMGRLLWAGLIGACIGILVPNAAGKDGRKKTG